MSPTIFELWVIEIRNPNIHCHSFLFWIFYKKFFKNRLLKFIEVNHKCPVWLKGDYLNKWHWQTTVTMTIEGTRGSWMHVAWTNSFSTLRVASILIVRTLNLLFKFLKISDSQKKNNNKVFKNILMLSLYTIIYYL